ncbi:unnamed protein product, partial [marine sediment metagenome]
AYGRKIEAHTLHTSSTVKTSAAGNSRSYGYPFSDFVAINFTA